MHDKHNFPISFFKSVFIAVEKEFGQDLLGEVMALELVGKSLELVNSNFLIFQMNIWDLRKWSELGNNLIYIFLMYTPSTFTLCGLVPKHNTNFQPRVPISKA